MSALVTSATLASTTPLRAAGQNLIEQPEIIGISAAVALGIFATAATYMHMAGRKSAAKREAALNAELAAVRARLDRAEVFLASEPQVNICWNSAHGEPDIEGDVGQLIELNPPRRVLASGPWPSPAAAQQPERVVERLRLPGESFRLPLATLSGRPPADRGRPRGGRARISPVVVSG